MPQLDKLTYFSQFFWLCLLLFTFYILFFNNNNGILGISRILKLRNQLLSHRGNKIRSKDPKNLEDISRKGFSTGLSYMYSSLSEVSQWCKTVDYLGKRRKITLISDFGEISGSRGMERQILYLISKSSYNTSSSRITCWKNIMLTHVPHGQGGLTNERKMEPDASLKGNIESQTTHALDSRRNTMNRRFFSSKAGGGESSDEDGNSSAKGHFKRWVLESEYKDFPGLHKRIDALLEELAPSDILFIVHTFPREIPLLEILSPQDLKNVIAHVQEQGSDYRRSLSSKAEGGASKEDFKYFLLEESDYKSVPGLRDHIDALLEVLEPAEILRFLHTFPQDIVNLLDFMSPQDIKEILVKQAEEERRRSAEESEEFKK